MNEGSPATGTHTAGPPRRPHLPDVRPLDSFRSLKIKLGVLVAATVTFAVIITWVGLQNHLGPSRTFPLAFVLSLLLTQILARGMTSPLREMTAAARSMADGDYTRRVRATSRDEVGQLAMAFNVMAEDLASADQVRRELIANVSHELRTPIAALQAQLENLVDGVVQPSAATMEMALAQTERLSRLIAYLLDLSRIEAGASALNITTIPLGDFLEEQAHALSMVEADKSLSYVVDVTPPDLTLDADRLRLGQIITNLVNNAIRHSPASGEIRLEAYPDDGAIIIDIVDEGPGIAKQDRERVFERFARGPGAHSAYQPSTGGTGIGLSIVRWAVELHGGHIEVADSRRGATMRVTLPVRPPTGTPDESSEATDPQ